MSSDVHFKKHRGGFPWGMTPITRESESPYKIDFGIFKIEPGATISQTSPTKESVWVLLNGQARIEWDGGEEVVERNSLFDQSPSALHVCASRPVQVTSSGQGSEWAFIQATNDTSFSTQFYRPSDIRSELRGRGLAQNTCTRNVKTIFDYSTRKESQLVVGEVVNFPGRWSSYPPHHHKQPELYHYRFTLPQGYGHAEVGEEVYRVCCNDTVGIAGGLDHGQVSAPGYGMYYLWIVRHLSDDPYVGFEFTEEHQWILDPKNQGWEPTI